MNSVTSKMSHVIKDKSNILNKNQCVTFIKDYQFYPENNLKNLDGYVTT